MSTDPVAHGDALLARLSQFGADIRSSPLSEHLALINEFDADVRKLING